MEHRLNTIKICKHKQKRDRNHDRIAEYYKRVRKKMKIKMKRKTQQRNSQQALNKSNKCAHLTEDDVEVSCSFVPCYAYNNSDKIDITNKTTSKNLNEHQWAIYNAITIDTTKTMA